MEKGATRITRGPLTVGDLCDIIDATRAEVIKELAGRGVSAKNATLISNLDAIAVAARHGVRLVIEN